MKNLRESSPFVDIVLNVSYPYHRPASSFDRRNLRYMSDELGLNHTTRYVEDPVTGRSVYTITVSKPLRERGSDWVVPVTYAELVKEDSRRVENMRRFEGEPPHWPVVREFLIRISDGALAMVCSHLLRRMSHYSDVSWAFLVVDLLRQRDIPIPVEIFSSILKMCRETCDVYGVIEMLHIAKMERMRLNEDDVYKQRQVALSRKFFNAPADEGDAAADLVSSPVAEEAIESGGDNGMKENNRHYRVMDRSYYTVSDGSDGSPVEVLSRSDWNRAVVVAFHSRSSRISFESYKAAFAEVCMSCGNDIVSLISVPQVMRMMRECGVSLESGTMYSLLRFLVTTRANNDMLLKLIGRIARDETYDVTHIECLSMTLYLVDRRISRGSSPFRYSSPRFSHINYLLVNHGHMSEVRFLFIVVLLFSSFIFRWCETLWMPLDGWARSPSDLSRPSSPRRALQKVRYIGLTFIGQTDDFCRSGGALLLLERSHTGRRWWQAAPDHKRTLDVGDRIPHVHLLGLPGGSARRRVPTCFQHDV